MDEKKIVTELKDWFTYMGWEREGEKGVVALKEWFCTSVISTKIRCAGPNIVGEWKTHFHILEFFAMVNLNL